MSAGRFGPKVVALADQGLSPKEIAYALETTSDYVRVVLRRAGFEPVRVWRRMTPALPLLKKTEAA